MQFFITSNFQIHFQISVAQVRRKNLASRAALIGVNATLKILKKNILIIVMEKWLYFADKRQVDWPFSWCMILKWNVVPLSIIINNNNNNNHGNLLQCSGSFKCLSYYKVYLFPSCIKLVG